MDDQSNNSININKSVVGSVSGGKSNNKNSGTVKALFVSILVIFFMFLAVLGIINKDNIVDFLGNLFQVIK